MRLVAHRKFPRVPGRRPRALRALGLALAASVLSLTLVRAQESDEGPPVPDIPPELFAQVEEGAPGRADERGAWGLVRAEQHFEARDVATDILRRDPESYIAHFVLAHVEHYREANFPRALFHAERAWSLFRARSEDHQADAWLWHARLLREIAYAHHDMEHYEQRLAYSGQFNEFAETMGFVPEMAELAWPLMKLRRFDEARRAAQQGIASGRPRQRAIGLNAMCAVEFEAGDINASYQACRIAYENARAMGEPDPTELTNFAEASRSVFRLDECERVLLEATELPASWYANPWQELAELYLRSARHAEALDALRRVPDYRAARPPYVRESDRNESRRALASFYLLAGRAEEALRYTREAMIRPDRRAHTSRDPAQDRIVAALLDRRAHLTEAERVLERAAAEGIGALAMAQVRARWLRFQAWLSGRKALQELSAEGRMVGTLRIGTADAAIMPPWLVGEVASVAGAGVLRVASREARARDDRLGADAYYDAFAAEAAAVAGDEERTLELVERATAALGPGEAQLGVRLQGLRAAALLARGERGAAIEAIESVFDADPGVLRRLGLRVPVTLEIGGDELAEEVADALAWSPRLDVGEGSGALRVQGEVTAAGGRLCISSSRTATQFGCGEVHAERDDTPARLVERLVDEFHLHAFAPRIDLSQADIGSLDGSNQSTRRSLDTLLEGEESSENGNDPASL